MEYIITISWTEKFINLGLEFSSMRVDFCEKEGLDFCWMLLKEMALAKKNIQRSLVNKKWFYLYFKEYSIEDTKLGIDESEKRKNSIPDKEYYVEN